MMNAFILIFVLWASSVESFGIVPATGTFSRFSTSLAALKSSSPTPSPYDEVLDRLQGEYKALQDELLEDLVKKNDKAAAEDVAEEMLEKAAATVAVQKYKHQEELDKAHADALNAEEDVKKVKALEREAHGDAEGADAEAGMLETIDAAYEELERLRDSSVAHASRHLEEDLRDVEIESTFRQLEAEDREEKEAETLERLDENLRRLQQTVRDLREERRQRARDKWSEKKP